MYTNNGPGFAIAGRRTVTTIVAFSTLTSTDEITAGITLNGDMTFTISNAPRSCAKSIGDRPFLASFPHATLTSFRFTGLSPCSQQNFTAWLLFAEIAKKRRFQKDGEGSE